MKPRYLTKSRFKLAMECPTKLYYTGKKEYVNKKLEDPFLEALADGGYQVGELAKFYFPSGKEVETLDYEESLKETNGLLEKENCIIYEAAITYKDFYIRADVLVKEGKNIKLIEVKAKSASGSTEDVFINKSGNISSEWIPYLNDIAFQKYVTVNALPDYHILSYLMLVDRNSICLTDGLNQKFKIKRDNTGRKYTLVSKDITKKDLESKLLVQINTDKMCEKIYKKEYSFEGKKLSFKDLIDKFAENYKADIIIEPNISKECKNCEFKADKEEMAKGLRSGYHECFKKKLKWTDDDFEEGTIFDIWRFLKTDFYIKQNKIKLSAITKNDINPESDDMADLSNKQRQWLQVKKSQNKDNSYWVDKAGLKEEMEKWKYPLHFIDFETSAPAIPFNKGRHPYEGIAFQFSHHIVYKNGTIEHKGQFLNAEAGVFPNYDFARELKKELEKDEGTIFRYADHENTYLCKIYNQLKSDNSSIEDKEELCEFILKITECKNSSKEKIIGPRNMVDMLKLVKRFYYHPSMKGSNSIKDVLPAIINSSRLLKEKYSKPIYGAKEGIKSLNFKDWTWVEFDNGRVIDPYDLLSNTFSNDLDKDSDILDLPDGIRDGGAAMTAYERLQFEDLEENERENIKKALLKYCELDTLAMVMLYEGWRDIINGK